ncbi:flavin-dependent dehydrogenase [Acaryochloris sp. IP29b_bin.148]|uniref:flavin-dependent dehydrogenase n=1 Tax=Acaryochloris sp. IP29b_bin.148 TaxID=2969218 RepID=UPI00262362FF|nr:flavin-dependent dehydrogenase [Acaryochloris sp. IP29b_bin.148]
MKQLLYLEIPTPDLAAVQTWLHQQTADMLGLSTSVVTPTTSGIHITAGSAKLVVFLWRHLNTTYLKVMQWSDQPLAGQQAWLRSFEATLKSAFPYAPKPFPEIDLAQTDIFSALAPHYPLTAKYFQNIPNGEADLQRAYWWEKRWRDTVKLGPQPPKVQPIVESAPPAQPDSTWDLVIVGGALGALTAAMMARLGYKVALVERIKFGRMNREWNISRSELQTLVDVGLLTTDELETLIAREYQDNFNLFFSGNNPPAARSSVLYTPTVLNVAMDCDRLLQLCGEKLLAAGGQIFECTEFEQAYLESDAVTIQVRDLKTDQVSYMQSTLLIDAMGTASQIAQQINGGQAFDSVCPTIGGVVKDGFASGVWDQDYGEPLFTNGDTSRGRQLIWEMFPGEGNDITIYLFYYHQISPENPGSLLELFEDFFACLPDYRRCDLDQLEWRKAAFGYIPGRFSRNAQDRLPGCDRILSIGDAASLNSPLIFTGFGSLVRNLPRVTHLLHTALQHNLVSGEDLGLVNAYQDNLAATWIFSRGMMAKPQTTLPPYWINAILNAFFGVLSTEPPDEVDDFIKDRGGWLFMTRTILKAGLRMPKIPWWVARAIGFKELFSWVPTYFTFTWAALLSFLFSGWLPQLLQRWQQPLAQYWPQTWLRLLSWSYRLTYGIGKPKLMLHLPPLTDLAIADTPAIESSATETVSSLPH